MLAFRDVPSWSRRIVLGSWIVACVASIGFGLARADLKLVLHEFFTPDPAEDLRLGARAELATLPAAIETEVGVVRAPTTERPASTAEPLYGQRRVEAGESFQIDGQTGPEGRLSYHEPYRPSIAPFKRTRSFDAVDARFQLVVADPSLRPVGVGASVGDGWAQFYGDLTIDAAPSELIRIPSVGAGMRVLALGSDPAAELSLLSDQAENLFVTVRGARGKLRLLLHAAVEPHVLRPAMEAQIWSELRAALPLLPENVVRSGREVAEQLGITDQMRPVEALRVLIEVFRGFTASASSATGLKGEALYRELVARRHGVCRHRSYAFVVTALAVGLPARFVHNEAHAWVEVFGGRTWHRVDLGGAAAGFDFRGARPDGPAYRGLADPFPFPPAAGAGVAALTEDMGSAVSLQPWGGSGAADPPASSEDFQGGIAPADSAPGEQATAPTLPENPNADVADAVSLASAASDEREVPSPRPSLASSASVSMTAAPSSQPSNSPLQPSVLIEGQILGPGSVMRGEKLTVSGLARLGSEPCSRVPVAIVLVRGGTKNAVGSALTDEHGHFEATLTVPTMLEVGPYGVSFEAPAGALCASRGADSGRSHSYGRRSGSTRGAM